jgi:Rrf2 family protein
MDLTLSKRGDYVVRAAICLARTWDGSGAYCKIREVADAMDLPRSYTPQLLGVLAKAGLAEAKAGRVGGYRLLRDPSEISVLEVIEAAVRATGTTSARSTRRGRGPPRRSAPPLPSRRSPRLRPWTASSRRVSPWPRRRWATARGPRAAERPPEGRKRRHAWAVRPSLAFPCGRTT